MIIALGIIGYIAIGIIVGAVAYRFTSEHVANDGPLQALGCCVFWPLAMLAAVVVGVGTCLFLLIEWVAEIPERRRTDG